MTDIQIEWKQCPNPNAATAMVNFNLKLNPELFFILSNVEGVENLDSSASRGFLSKYNFSVFKGSLFDWAPIRETIEEKIKNHFEE